MKDTSTKSSSAPKPFFLMDWLEDLVQDQDVEKIAEMLQTPNRKKTTPRWNTPPRSVSHSSFEKESVTPGTPKSSNRKNRLRYSSSSPDCRQPSSPTTSMKPQRLFDNTSQERQPEPSSRRSSPTNTTPSSMYKKSLALGNGWNAKGLKKAQQGLWQDALSCWDNALEIRHQLLGKMNLEVANTYNNRGIALGKLGHYDLAIEALQQALDIRVELLQTPHHPQVISTLHNLANVHHQVGNLQLALQVFGRAKELSLNNPHDQTARICTAMGHVYYQAQQWIDARDAYQDALQLYKLTTSNSASSQEMLNLQRDIEELDQRLQSERQDLQGQGLRLTSS